MQDQDDGIGQHHWQALAKGERSSFAWIYNRYFKLLFNYGRKIGVDDARLEDAIHDLFVDLWRYRENLSPTTSIRFYLYRSLRRRLVRNDSRNYFTPAGQLIENVLGMTSPSSEQEMIDTETSHQRVHRLRKLLNDLAPRQYEALILRFYDEFSYDEIAATLHVSEQSARNLVQRGLLQLRQYARHVISLLSFVLLF